MNGISDWGTRHGSQALGTGTRHLKAGLAYGWLEMAWTGRDTTGAGRDGTDGYY